MGTFQHSKRTLFIPLMLFISFNLTAQAYCVEGEFVFKWHNQYISDMDKGYVCDYSMPDTITIVDHNGDPVSANVTWTNATVISGQIGWENKAIIHSSNFGSAYNITVTANFDYPGSEPHSMELKLDRDVFLYFDKYEGFSIFAMDSNLISGYSTYTTGSITSLPYKFLLPSVLDAVRGITFPKAAYYSPYFNSTSSELEFNPRRFEVDPDTLLAEYDGTLVSDTLKTLIYGCSSDPEAVIFVGNPIFKTITFIFLCDTSGTCTSIIDPLRTVDEANKILNTAGLLVYIDTAFWDTIAWDINQDGILDTLEQMELHEWYRVTSDSIKWESDYLVWVVPDLGHNKSGKVAGRATYLISNSLALDATDFKDGLTLAHEIGHAAFGFYHPRDMGDAPGIIDRNNFMYHFRPVINNIRAHQFITIHAIR